MEAYADESAGVGDGCFGLDLLDKSIFEFGGGGFGGRGGGGGGGGGGAEEGHCVCHCMYIVA